MQPFAKLIHALEVQNSPTLQGEALIRYFKAASPEDAAWAVYFLCGNKLSRTVSLPDLRTWTQAHTQLPDWLFDLSMNQASTVLEGLCLLIDTCQHREPESDAPLHHWLTQRILPLADLDPDEQQCHTRALWSQLTLPGLRMVNKLLTGRSLSRLPRPTLVEALALCFEVDPATLAHRLSAYDSPTAEAFEALIAPETEFRPQPFPFHPVAHAAPVSGELEDPSHWHGQWHWAGIRVHAIHQDNRVWIWSENRQWLMPHFPEITEALHALPEDTIVEGHLVIWQNNRPQHQPDALHRRLTHYQFSSSLLEAEPACLLISDLLMVAGQDVREHPLAHRHQVLQEMMEAMTGPLKLAPVVSLESWEALDATLATARTMGAEGILFKSRQAPYGGDPWLLCKPGIQTLHAVLMYVQPSDALGRSLEYTFGLWHDGELVPIARTSEGLTEAEEADLEQWIRDNTEQRFGPVRAVSVMQVFELAYDEIQASNRHKAGATLRNAKIAAWHRFQSVFEAHHLDAIKARIPSSTAETQPVIL